MNVLISNANYENKKIIMSNTESNKTNNKFKKFGISFCTTFYRQMYNSFYSIYTTLQFTHNYHKYNYIIDYILLVSSIYGYESCGL